MGYIKGKVRQIIYEGSNGYKIGLFKVKDTDDEEVKDFLIVPLLLPVPLWN